MALNQHLDSASGPERGTRRLHLRDVKGADAGAPYDSVGADLRAARVRAGKDLGEVARALRIGEGHLEAIEEGRFEALPGRAYALGFLRSYAEHLGLDGTAVVEAFKDETSPYAARSKLVFPTPAPAGRSPGATSDRGLDSTGRSGFLPVGTRSRSANVRSSSWFRRCPRT